jgi:hypothetical protein
MLDTHRSKRNQEGHQALRENPIKNKDHRPSPMDFRVGAWSAGDAGRYRRPQCSDSGPGRGSMALSVPATGDSADADALHLIGISAIHRHGSIRWRLGTAVAGLLEVGLGNSPRTRFILARQAS